MDNSTRHIAPTTSNLQYVARNKCYEMAYNETKNRIYFCVLGFWKNEESVPELLNDWDKLLQLVSPGFTMLLDMRTMITHPQQLFGLHEQSMQKVRDKGVSNIASIMPNDKIASLQVSEIATRSNMMLQTFETHEAANKWLDEKMA